MANAESTLEMKLKQLKRTEDKASDVLKLRQEAICDIETPDKHKVITNRSG